MTQSGTATTVAPLRPAPDPPGGPRSLEAMGWARWAWRTLTSMRTALILLALVALASVPGSLLPQRGISPGQVANFIEMNPSVSPWLDRLGFFDVFSSPWFAATYLLLMVSLTGCVLPRCRRLLLAALAAPAPAPRALHRLTGYQRWNVGQPASTVLEAASTELRRRGYRVRVDDASVSAEKGYLREVGNLGFHLSLLVLLFGVAGGQLYGFEGRVVVVEGEGFANTRAQYDDFVPGPWVDEARLEPFSFTLEDFSAAYQTSGPQMGTPTDFTADVRWTQGLGPEAEEKPFTIKVNTPLEVNGTKVFLTGNGYAPRFTVRDGTGATVFGGPAVFLPRDGSFTSDGVVKVPDAQPSQLGFEGFFLPTAAVGAQGPYSAYPDLVDPRALLTAFTGDLNLDSGPSQSVYTLDKSDLEQVVVDGEPLAEALAVGQTMTLPDGQGSITFDGVSRFANFQIADDPGKGVSLVAAVLLLAGLTMSLTIRQRRVLVRAEPAPVGASVQLAGQPRTRSGMSPGELDDLAETLRQVAPFDPHLEEKSR